MAQDLILAGLGEVHHPVLLQQLPQRPGRPQGMFVVCQYPHAIAGQRFMGELLTGQIARRAESKLHLAGAQQ
ncbi:hypothetical protein D3C80_2148960 [compost metagenome]